MDRNFRKILIATGNKGKFTEISTLLKGINIDSVGIWEFDGLEEPEETGKTFSENSLIKAKYYAKKTGLVSLADDSGICIEDLDNKPGIYSARYAVNELNNKTDFPYAFQKISDELKEKNIAENSKPKAHFICNLTIFDPKDNFHIDFEGRVDGSLTFPPKGTSGFGYDPIFIKNGMSETFGEIDRFEKDTISHRGNAFEKMVKWLNSHL